MRKVRCRHKLNGLFCLLKNGAAGTIRAGRPSLLSPALYPMAWLDIMLDLPDTARETLEVWLRFRLTTARA
jgi:hypothetical protein